MLSSCALLGRFAIDARVALLLQHNANRKCQRVLVLDLRLVATTTTTTTTTTHIININTHAQKHARVLSSPLCIFMLYLQFM